jgi:hypothetical protein
MTYRRDGIIFSRFFDCAWGEVRIARIIPTENNWGAYHEISELEMSSLIPEIEIETIDRASRGDCTPLLNSGLREPNGCLKMLKVPKDCDEQKACLSFDKKKCQMGNRKMPDCFSPITNPLLRPLVIAWLEGYHIIREVTV